MVWRSSAFFAASPCESFGLQENNNGLEPNFVADDQDKVPHLGTRLSF